MVSMVSLDFYSIYLLLFINKLNNSHLNTPYYGVFKYNLPKIFAQYRMRHLLIITLHHFGATTKVTLTVWVECLRSMI